LGSARVFGLTLFAIAALAVLVFGWQAGEPWTAAAFVIFFVSRVWRSVIKHPLGGAGGRDRARDARRFMRVTAGGWLLSAALATGATLAGEGREWIYVAPCFAIFGLLWLALSRA
jgi:hypothetical protein